MRLNFFLNNFIWKESLQMDNTSYLPVVPIFSVAKNNSVPMYFYDVLTTNKENDVVNNYIIDLNNKTDPVSTMSMIKKECKSFHNSRACLLYGRIFEFGSYNYPENITRAMKYYQYAYDLSHTVSAAVLSDSYLPSHE